MGRIDGIGGLNQRGRGGGITNMRLTTDYRRGRAQGSIIQGAVSTLTLRIVHEVHSSQLWAVEQDISYLF